MVKRIVTLLLTVLLLIVSVGCQPAVQSPEEDTPTDGDVPQGTVIDEEYVIVFPQGYNVYIDRATSNLQMAIQKKTGVKIGVRSDRDEAQEKEILVGYTNRVDRESIKAPITLVGEKLVFAVNDPARLYCIVEAFVDGCLDAGAVDDTGKLLLTEDIVSRIGTAGTVYAEKLTVLTQNLRYRDDEGGNSVAERSERFLALVEEYSPDIIGTQEATPLWTQYLGKHFGDEYSRVGVFRDGTGAAGDEANYILYKKDRFTVEDSGTFWLNPGNPEVVGKVEDALCNRICTWALLKDHVSDQTLLVCNTHLDHSNDIIRAQQLSVLLEYLSFEIGLYPVVLTGDFNMLRDSEPYKAIGKAGLLDGQRTAWLDESTVDHSCHLYTDDGEIIDYCFYSKQFLPFYAKTISDDYGGYVSDHYGVLVELVPLRK